MRNDLAQQDLRGAIFHKLKFTKWEILRQVCQQGNSEVQLKYLAHQFELSNEPTIWQLEKHGAERK